MLVNVGPQLSSVSTALHDLTTRVSDLAESLSGSPREDVANALYEVERSMSTAARRLDQLVSDLT